MLYARKNPEDPGAWTSFREEIQWFSTKMDATDYMEDLKRSGKSRPEVIGFVARVMDEERLDRFLVEKVLLDDEGSD